jgi:hypothetical protein
MKVHRSGKPFDLDKFLARPLFAHLATGSLEGPRESPVWFLWEDGAIWLIGTSSDGFPKRIANEARCALGFVDFDLGQGFLQHVGMREKQPWNLLAAIDFTGCCDAISATIEQPGTGNSEKP